MACTLTDTMSSRIDYLSKYLLTSDTDKLKKKKKKRSHHKLSDQNDTSDSTAVVVGTVPLPTTHIEETTPLRPELEDPENEDAPIVLQPKNLSKANKGFRRIDNGMVVSNTNDSTESTNASKSNTDTMNQRLEQGETIYRDKSGRIIDIEGKRAEMADKAVKAEQEAKQLQENLNTGDVDKLKNASDDMKLSNATRFDVAKSSEEYVSLMKGKEQFDDPLLAFSQKEEKVEVSSTGRPTYGKGIQPVNRFNIPAGHFWDGIDRSNGFEQRLVTKRNDLKINSLVEKNSKESYTEYDYE